MARIIEFRPIQQANFSDSNQALALSYDQYDKAIKQANSVADYFNQVVNNRNEAEIQGYINSIPQDEWQARQGEIDAKIAQIAEQSGNQFDPKVINTYRDLRYPTLLERDTKEMAHTTAKQVFGAEQLAWANRAKEYAKTPEEMAQIDAILEKYSNPQTQAQAHAVQDTLATEIFNNQTNKLQAEQGLVKARLFDELPAFENTVQKLTRQSAILGITPQEHKDYERIKNQVAQFQNQVNSYLNNPKYTPTQTAIFQNVLNQKYPEAFELISKMNKDRQAQANKDRDYELDKYKAQNTANYQQGQLEIGRQNANSTALNAYTNATKKDVKTDGSRTTNKELNTLINQAGIPNIFITNQQTGKAQFNRLGLQNHFDVLAKKIASDTQHEFAKQSYGNWVSSKEGQEILSSSNAKDRKLWFGKTKVERAIEDLQQRANQLGQPLTDDEKINIATKVADGTIRYDNWSDFGGDLERLERALYNHRTSKDNKIFENQRSAFLNHLSLISQETGLPMADIIINMGILENPKMKHIYNLFPKNELEAITAYYQELVKKRKEQNVKERNIPK